MPRSKTRCCVGAKSHQLCAAARPRRAKFIGGKQSTVQCAPGHSTMGSEYSMYLYNQKHVDHGILQQSLEKSLTVF